MDWIVKFTSLPADALKAIGTVAVGGLLALGTYVVARIKESRRPADQQPGLPRLSLSPEDRDLAFTLVRAGTDLTRALHEHGEILRGGGGGNGGAAAPRSRPPRMPRTRPERPMP
jgi:hypothetical protein